VRSRTRVDLPAAVERPFEVFVNGVPQAESVDFRVAGRALVFERDLRREGKLGFWRWASNFLGIAGSYGRNDVVDVVYAVGGRRQVATGLPLVPAEGDTAG